ncbi:MAG: 2-phospho-L-lactate transferase [Methanosarcinaceae archaeon]|nr:2-phospho-L-lactate transferase [Methanosarcinaceae archaeon]NKQ38249.1 2-phospho-L-lactate transferase [Methanosarcinales archaeon]
MITLSGGTGTPKLLHGIENIIPQKEIAVIVNTAEDLWVSGNLITPDIDTILYMFSNKIDLKKWWGIKDDSFNTHNQLKSIESNESMMIGDMDRATHIIRSDFIRNGDSLTIAIQKLSALFEIEANVMPMSDDPLATMITTEQEEMHFQDFWIKYKGKPNIINISIKGIENASISKNAIDALKSNNNVLIGPSNPITSIGPIIELPKMRNILKSKKVVAISPIIGNKPISGPAAKLMQAKGFEVSSIGVAEYYKDFLDVFIIDKKDTVKLSDFKNIGCEVIRADTLMTNMEKSTCLAKIAIDAFKNM